VNIRLLAFVFALEVLVNNTKSKVWSFYQINSITKNEIFFDENCWHFKPKIADMIFARIYNILKILVSC